MNTLFEQAIECNLTDVKFFSVGVCPSCAQCGEDYGFDSQAEFGLAYASGSVCEEGSFSWRPCDSCQSSLGGDRHAAHGDIDGELCHFSICVDCLLYHANGDLPEQWET